MKEEDMKKIIIVGATALTVALVGYFAFVKWANKNTYR